MLKKRVEGSLIGTHQRHAIIVSRFNEFITEKLLEGALTAYEKHGVSESDIQIFGVPGAYEIGPLGSNWLKPENLMLFVAWVPLFAGLLRISTMCRGKPPTW